MAYYYPGLNRAGHAIADKLEREKHDAAWAKYYADKALAKREADPLEVAARAYIAACEGRHPDPDVALSNLIREAAKSHDK